MWAGSAVVLVLASVLLLLVQDPRYFFRGDTQAAYLGWEYRLGEQVRAGHWPRPGPAAWVAGNAVARVSGGCSGPLVVGIGLVATVSSNVQVFATALKVFLVGVGVLGVFLLARSYDATAPLAFVAAVAVPFGGMTQYLDLRRGGRADDLGAAAVGVVGAAAHECSTARTRSSSSGSATCW